MSKLFTTRFTKWCANVLEKRAAQLAAQAAQCCGTLTFEIRILEVTRPIHRTAGGGGSKEKKQIFTRGGSAQRAAPSGTAGRTAVAKLSEKK
jgi:hypothetical protein